METNPNAANGNPVVPVQVTGLLSEALTEHITQRMTAALNQHAAVVTEVSVRMSDINGPRGGIDKRCRADVRLKGQAPLIVEQTGADAYAVASEVADRVKQAAGRLLDKRLEPRRDAARKR